MRRKKNRPPGPSSRKRYPIQLVEQKSNAAARAGGPLEKLRDSVLRYDNPTDPVWPCNEGGDCTIL